MKVLEEVLFLMSEVPLYVVGRHREAPKCANSFAEILIFSCSATDLGATL
jgi:hypothetical protein